MTEDLMQRLRDGKITTRNLDGQRRSAFKRAGSARSRLRSVLRDVASAGIQHVEDELERQGEQ